MQKNKKNQPKNCERDTPFFCEGKLYKEQKRE